MLLRLLSQAYSASVAADVADPSFILRKGPFLRMKLERLSRALTSNSLA
jgi:hypothetical protein